MSNKQHVTTNRFSVLLEPTKTNNNYSQKHDNYFKKRDNFFKNHDNYSNKNSHYGDKYFDYNNKFIKSMEKKNREKAIEKKLDIKNFPSINSVSLVDNKNKKFVGISFADKTKHRNNPTIKNNIKLPEGWVAITKDTTCSYKKQNKNAVSNKNNLKNVNDVFNGVCDNYIKYYLEYIERWGESEWEKMYLFPNYDYDYDYDYNGDDSDDDESCESEDDDY